MIHGCLGVSNQYLGQHTEAAQNFRDALDTLHFMSPSPESPPVQIHVLPNVGFSMTERDVAFNLLLALKNAGSCERCLMEGFKVMNVNPDMTEGSALLLLFSSVDWNASIALREAVDAVEKREKASGRLLLRENTTLYSEVIFTLIIYPLLI